MRTFGLLIIWLVTAVDIYCCQWLTTDQEQNPLAALILACGGVWSLVSLKVIGTFAATEILRKLHWGYLAAFDVLGICLVGYLLT